MWRPAILQRAESVLLDEKASKLTGVARILDQALGDGFDFWLERAGVSPSAPPEVRLAALTEALRGPTDRICEAFPSLGLGYYEATLDRIVAYAPSQELGGLVGVPLPPEHLGRAAMESRTDRISIGSMVRGDAMNCMHPLIRGERVIGFAFANESVDDIYRQIQSSSGRTHLASEMNALPGLFSLIVLAGSSGHSASSLRRQLGKRLQAGDASAASEARSLMLGLRQIESYLRLFLDSLSLGLVLVDARGRVNLCNKSFGRLTGIAANRLPGRSFAAVMRTLGVTESFAAGKGQDPESRRFFNPTLRRGDGSTVEVSVLASSLPGAAGADGATLLLFEDTGAARREDEYFRRAERLAAAGELATAIAHEIRNPLTVVAGSIQLIPDRLDDPAFLLSVSRIAGEELARINRVIQGLLGFAKYSEPEMRPVSVNGWLAEAVEFIRWYARKHGVEVALEVPPATPWVYGDREHLRQALVNLMINGVQAMPRGGRLVVAASDTGGNRLVRISVRDEGVGIRPENLTRIWDVFYSSKAGGTGLGLPLVHRIVDEHRGYVDVESVPDAGTCFTISLPLCSTPEE